MPLNWMMPLNHLLKVQSNLLQSTVKAESSICGYGLKHSDCYCLGQWEPVSIKDAYKVSYSLPLWCFLYCSRNTEWSPLWGMDSHTTHPETEAVTYKTDRQTHIEQSDTGLKQFNRRPSGRHRSRLVQQTDRGQDTGSMTERIQIWTHSWLSDWKGKFFSFHDTDIFLVTQV